MFPNKADQLYSANFPGLVDLVEGESGRVWYMIWDKDNGLRVVPEYESNGTKLIPPTRKHLPFLLPRAEKVIEHYSNGEDTQLAQDVLTYLKRFSYLPDHQWIIAVCKIFLTNIQHHPDIYYMPILLLFGDPERGKTKTGKAITYISYRGIHLPDIREPHLFRLTEYLNATLFFDIKDISGKLEQNKSEDVLLLRFEKGAKVPRVLDYKKGPFEDMKYYDTYGPTIIATNEPLHKILDSRCIPIALQNRPGTYEDPRPEFGHELKERLTAWRARMFSQRLPEINPIEGISGRIWDISKPLIQVCRTVYPEGVEMLIEALREVAVHRTQDRRISIEGEILQVLYEILHREETEMSIEMHCLTERLNENRESSKLTPQYIGKRLKAMGIQTKLIHGYSNINIKKEEFDLLCRQHGIEEITDAHNSVETLPNSNSHQAGDIDLIPAEVAEQQTTQVTEQNNLVH